MESIDQAVQQITTEAMKQFPDLDRETAARMAMITMAFMLLYPDLSPEEVTKEAQNHVTREAHAGKEWAMQMGRNFAEGCRKTYDRALSQNGDPVEMIRVMHGLPKEVAEEFVRVLGSSS